MHTVHVCFLDYDIFGNILAVLIKVLFTIFFCRKWKLSLENQHESTCMRNISINKWRQFGWIEIIISNINVDIQSCCYLLVQLFWDPFKWRRANAHDYCSLKGINRITFTRYLLKVLEKNLLPLREGRKKKDEKREVVGGEWMSSRTRPHIKLPSSWTSGLS